MPLIHAHCELIEDFSLVFLGCAASDVARRAPITSCHSCSSTFGHSRADSTSAASPSPPPIHLSMASLLTRLAAGTFTALRAAPPAAGLRLGLTGQAAAVGAVPTGVPGLAASATVITTAAPAVTGTRSFKTKTALRRMCRGCRIVTRGKRVFVLCEDNPRHKQRTGRGGAAYKA